jgi:hypothetical protein
MQRYEKTVWMSKAADPNKTESFTTGRVKRFSGSKKRDGIKRKFKRFRGPAETLDTLVLNTIQAMTAETGRSSICAEEVGYRLDIRVDQIKHSLHRMNLAGHVSQAYREHAHDTNRARMFGGPNSGWAANRYNMNNIPLK